MISVTHRPAAKQLDNSMPSTKTTEASLDSHTQSAEDKYNVCEHIGTDYPQSFDALILKSCWFASQIPADKFPFPDLFISYNFVGEGGVWGGVQLCE